MKTGQCGASPVPGRQMPMFAAFDSPGPFTTQPMTASVIVSTPSYCVFHSGILLAHVVLDPLGQLLERRATSCGRSRDRP